MAKTKLPEEIKPIETKPIGTPFKCVVCNGWGTVSNQRVTCHACGGKGYIVIPNEEDK